METETATRPIETGTLVDVDLLDNAGMDGDYLTISEAAARLGIGEKRLRRWLARPGNEGLTLASVRMRRTGPVNVAVLPTELLERIAADLQPAHEAGRGGHSEGTGTTGPEQGQKRHKPGTGNADDRVLEALESRVADLQAALESERQNNARLAESLALVRDVLRDNQEEVRQLRALTAPPEARPMPWWRWRRGR